MSLKTNLAEIVRIDNELREFVRSRKVIHMSELGDFKRLKSDRRFHVRTLRNYRPTGTTL